MDGMVGSFYAGYQPLGMLHEICGYIAGPIIRKDTLDLHALRRILGNGMPEEFHSRFRRLVRVDRCVGHTRSVIRECPACFLIFLSVVSSSHETDRLS